MKCGHPSTTEVSLSSNPILVFRGPAAIRRSASASASAFACFRGRGFHFRGPNLVSSHIAFLLGFFLTLLTCIELYITIYTTVYITIIYIYIYIHVSLYMYMLTARKPAQRFCIFFALWYIGGGIGGGVIMFCVYVIIDFLRWTHFMSRCTRLLYLGEHTSCYVAHVWCTWVNTLHVALHIGGFRHGSCVHTLIYTMWVPPIISWFVNPINYSYKYNKP